MLLKNISLCALLLTIGFTPLTASEPQLTRTTKEDLAFLAHVIHKKYKPDEQSYFTAQPKTYLGIQYKNGYVEIMQLLLAETETNIKKNNTSQ